jgi:hypothetical protein
MKTLRIGAGAGFAGDRIDPAVDLVRRGSLDYLVFECLAERTIALAQLSRRTGRNPGFDPMLRERMEAVLPHCAENRTRIISNMGAANPRAAASETAAIARSLGLTGLRIASVAGDDVLHLLSPDLASTLAIDPREQLVSANAYLGIEPLLECLGQQADVILTGRVADPSLFLAPMVHEFGWALDDWNRLGQGTAVGHLLECAGQLTGGYFADPGVKDVPDLARLGFPLAEVEESGEAVLTKLDGAGGALTVDTCKEQILYEVHDPSRYLTPDVTADFTGIRFTPLARDRIRASGARGSQRPATLKISAGLYAGFIAEGQISYAGPGALARATLARDILQTRLHWIPSGDLRIDFIGLSAIHGEALSVLSCDPYEVRLRAAARFFDGSEGRRLVQEVESLYVNGPAGGAGVTTSLRENIAMEPAFLSRESITPTIAWEVA